MENQDIGIKDEELLNEEEVEKETVLDKDTYTKEEVEEMLKGIKKETDTMTPDALLEVEKSLREKLNQEKEEELRLASLSAEERFKEELDKVKRDLNEYRVKEVSTALLSKYNIPLVYQNSLLGETVEETEERISNFAKVYKDTLQKEVKSAIKSTKLPSGAGNPNRVKGGSLSEYKKITDPSEKIKFLEEHPELVEKLK